MVAFFDRREKKQFFQGKQMFFSEIFWPRHNVFQPEGYIFFGLHPLTYHKPLHFDLFWFCIISWPIGRPPAEWRWVQRGPPCKSKETTFKNILKKATTTWWQQSGVDPSNNRLLKTIDLKSNKFQKYHSLENNNDWKKPANSKKKKTDLKKNKFQKTTDLKKQQILKKMHFKATNLKSKQT